MHHRILIKQRRAASVRRWDRGWRPVFVGTIEKRWHGFITRASISRRYLLIFLLLLLPLLLQLLAFLRRRRRRRRRCRRRGTNAEVAICSRAAPDWSILRELPTRIRKRVFRGSIIVGARILSRDVLLTAAFLSLSLSCGCRILQFDGFMRKFENGYGSSQSRVTDVPQ